IVVDPSHACGMSWMVPTLATAALAVGADGIMVEVHNCPECALCDGEQSLTPAQFDQNFFLFFFHNYSFIVQ
ncbi:MAG: hypothetical protein IKC64_04835, partial [Clostridia bacterium]|nr:hypothetical protein [Clostridia bacterium]